MRLKTNFNSNTQSGSTLQPISPGVYEAKIFSMEPGQASTGTQCLNIEFEILGPTHEGRHAWGNLYFTEKASWKTGALCNAVGITPSGELETRDLLGKKLRITVKEVVGADGNLRSEAMGFRKSKS
jgi:hypothetical protein